MTEVQYQRLVKLRDFIQELPYTKLEMGLYAWTWDDKNDCGTVCCALGWGVKLFPTELEWITDQGQHFVQLKNNYSPDNQSCDRIGAVLFGLSLECADHLFSSNNGYGRPSEQKVILLRKLNEQIENAKTT